MMRALVMSDSHGCGSILRRGIEWAWQCVGKAPIDAYIYCGDGVEDFQELESLLFAHDPRAQFHVVRGNRDDSSPEAPYEDVFSFGGANILVCHGQLYHVKSGLMYLEYAAREKNCTIALYGHTHVPSVEEAGGVTLINPGSARDRRIGLLEVKDGQVSYTPIQW